MSAQDTVHCTGLFRTQLSCIAQFKYVNVALRIRSTVLFVMEHFIRQDFDADKNTSPGTFYYNNIIILWPQCWVKVLPVGNSYYTSN